MAERKETRRKEEEMYLASLLGNGCAWWRRSPELGQRGGGRRRREEFGRIWRWTRWPPEKERAQISLSLNRFCEPRSVSLSPLPFPSPAELLFPPAAFVSRPLVTSRSRLDRGRRRRPESNKASIFPPRRRLRRPGGRPRTPCSLA